MIDVPTVRRPGQQLPRQAASTPRRADLATAVADPRGRCVHCCGPGRPRRMPLSGTHRAGQRRGHGSGAGVHRFLKGSAVVLAGSAGVAVALAVHAFARAWRPGHCSAPSHAPWRAGWPPCASALSSAVPSPTHSPSRPPRSVCCWPRGRDQRPSRLSEPARGLPLPAYQPAPAIPCRRHHDGRHHHRAGRPHRRLSLSEPASSHGAYPAEMAGGTQKPPLIHESEREDVACRKSAARPALHRCFGGPRQRPGK